MKLFPTLLILCFFIKFNAQDIEKMLIKAKKFEAKNKYEKALKTYNKILEEDNTNILTFARRGRCYFHLNLMDESLNDLLYFHRKYPNSSIVNVYLGSIYGSKGKHSKATTYYSNALKNGHKGNAFFYFNYGSSLYFSGKNDEAIIYLEKSYKMDSTNSGVYNNLAWSYLDTNPEKSCKYFKLAYEQDSLSDVSINNLGYAHLLNNDLEKALDLFKKANKINPENSFTYRNIGLYYKKKNDKKLACEYLQKAIEFKIIETWGEHYITELKDYCK